MKIYFDLDSPNDRAQVLELLTDSVPQADMEGGVNFMELEIRNADLSTRIKGVCHAEGIKTISDLCKLNYRELQRFPNLGEKSIADIRDCLLAYGVTLSPFRVRYQHD